MSIVIYVDGSHVYEHVDGKRLKKSKHAVGWGIVAHHDNETTEIHAARPITENQIGKHEYIAFIESLLYARAHGFKYEDMSFYTDELLLCDAQYMLHKGNYFNPETISRFKEKLKHVCKMFYDDSIYPQIIECIEKSRINWVKGHKESIYNIRVDYLAKYAAQSIIYPVMEPLLSFEEQFGKGILKRAATGTTRWYPPFITATEVKKLLNITSEEVITIPVSDSGDLIVDTNENISRPTEMDLN